MISSKTRSAAVRERLNHPVIDGDGHTVEVMPLLHDYIREVGGPKVLERFLASLPAGNRNHDGGLDRVGGPDGWWGLNRQERRDRRVTRASFWRLHTGNPVDRATVMLPKLYRQRLDELGIDYTILYTTNGINFLRNPDDELRRVCCRALNTMYADLFNPHRDRIAVPAVIPMYTPAEAIDEIDYAVGKLGLKSVLLGAGVRRPIRYVAERAPEYAAFATYIDVLAHASEYDYDPVWEKCVAMKVAVASHTGSMGWGTRTSPDNFVYNHIGHFAAAGEAFCKALIMGGVVRRFPQLSFAFLEGGVGWACGLYNDLVEHWEIRNVKAIKERLDPAKLDRTALDKLFVEFGGEKFAGKVAQMGKSAGSVLPDEDPRDLDDWAAAQVDDPRDFAAFFGRFYFGCEADDRMTAVAFNDKLNHFGVKLQAIFGSDIGHFDVPDITAVVAEAYELVEDGILSEDDFRAFTFTNAVKLHGAMNPEFFKGTSVEDAAARVLR